MPNSCACPRSSLARLPPPEPPLHRSKPPPATALTDRQQTNFPRTPARGRPFLVSPQNPRDSLPLRKSHSPPRAPSESFSTNPIALHPLRPSRVDASRCSSDKKSPVLLASP